MNGRSAAILRWTGEGDFADFESSVRFLLRERGVEARVSKAGGSVVVNGPEPLLVGTIFDHLPGVSWIAGGFTGASVGELAGASRILARRYLRRGGKFSVEAEVAKGEHPSDLAGAVTSSILGSVKELRILESGERTRFRAVLERGTGAVGVQVREGEGGVPTGDETVTCLVSGGMHSSVVAWMSVLAGYRVDMVHAESGDGGLLAVARLYSELSHRMDPRGLRLVVLDGGTQPGVLSSFVAKADGKVFGGFAAGGRAPPARFGGSVLAPLYLLPEDRFTAAFETLGIREERSTMKWTRGVGRRAKSREFGGKRADVSDVLDALA